MSDQLLQKDNSCWFAFRKRRLKLLYPPFITGNKSKCRGLLRKGKDFEAEPKELLLKAYDNFVEGKKILIDDREELTGFTYFRGKQKSSDSSVDSSPLSTGTPI